MLALDISLIDCIIKSVYLNIINKNILKYLHEMKDFCIITCTLLRKCIYLYLVQACMCVEAIY